MSVYGVRQAIATLRQVMAPSAPVWIEGKVSGNVLLCLNDLLKEFGELIGSKKARHPAHSSQIETLRERVEDCYSRFAATAAEAELEQRTAYPAIGLIVSSISEATSYIQEIDKAINSEKVPKDLLLAAQHENEELREVNKLLAETLGRGSYEIGILIEKSRAVGLAIDESWVISLCALNLLEPLVRLKLRQLGASDKGNFKEILARVRAEVTTREEREIAHMFPLALYEGIRNKIDHAAPETLPSLADKREVLNAVISFIDELFRPKQSVMT